MSIVGSFSWSLLEQGGSKAVGLLIQLILARILTPQVFGELAILLVVANIVDALAQSGFGSALIQKDKPTAIDYSTVFWLGMVFSGVLYAFILLLSPLFSSFYGIDQMTELLAVLALRLFPNVLNSIQRAHLQRSMQFRAIFFSNVSANVLSGVFGIVVALLGGGIWALILQNVLQSVISCAVMKIQVPWTPAFVFDTSAARSLYSFGWKISATTVLDTVYNGASEMLIGKVCTVSDLGLYSQGRKLPAAGISVMTNALQNVLFPAFSLIKEDKKRLVSLLKRSTVVGGYFVIPIGLFCSVVSEPLVRFLLTDKWIACAPIFAIAFLGSCFTFMQPLNLRTYMALGRSDLYLKLEIKKIALLTIVVVGIALLTRNIIAISASAALTGIVNVIGFDLSEAKSLHGYGRREQLQDIAPMLVSGLVSCVPTLVIKYLSCMIAPLPQIALLVLVFFASYFIASRAIAREAYREFLKAAKKVLHFQTA